MSCSCSSCLRSGFSWRICWWQLCCVIVLLTYVPDSLDKFVNGQLCYAVVLLAYIPDSHDIFVDVTLLFFLPCFRIIHMKLLSSSCIALLLPLAFNHIFSLCSFPLLSLKWTVCRYTMLKFWRFHKMINHVAINDINTLLRQLDVNKLINFKVLYSRCSRQTWHVQLTIVRLLHSLKVLTYDSGTCLHSNANRYAFSASCQLSNTNHFLLLSLKVSWKVFFRIGVVLYNQANNSEVIIHQHI